jgi:hypothetical protein
LTTPFHSAVDGTNGDTIQDPVEARFGHSEFVCTGGVMQADGQRGNTVDWDAHTNYGRIEDLLRLIVNGKPILKGDVKFPSKIAIPPGRVLVIDKLKRDSDFPLTQAVFTSDTAAEETADLE